MHAANEVPSHVDRGICLDFDFRRDPAIRTDEEGPVHEAVALGQGQRSDQKVDAVPRRLVPQRGKRRILGFRAQDIGLPRHDLPRIVRRDLVGPERVTRVGLHPARITDLDETVGTLVDVLGDELDDGLRPHRHAGALPVNQRLEVHSQGVQQP